MSVVARLAFGGAFFLSLLEMMVLRINSLSISSSNFRNAFLLLREKFPGDLICRRRKFPASAASGLCFMFPVSDCCVAGGVVREWYLVLLLLASSWFGCWGLTVLVSPIGFCVVTKCPLSRCPLPGCDPVWVGLFVGVSLWRCPGS